MTLGKRINQTIRLFKRVKSHAVSRKNFGHAFLFEGALYGLEHFKSGLSPSDLKLKLVDTEQGHGNESKQS